MIKIMMKYFFNCVMFMCYEYWNANDECYKIDESELLDVVIMKLWRCHWYCVSLVKWVNEYSPLYAAPLFHFCPMWDLDSCLDS